MQTITLASAPCGNERPNCRVLAPGAPPVKGLCQIHTAWCPDDHNARPRWEARTIFDQRTFRTGG
jgi:hypothetical protein